MVLTQVSAIVVYIVCGLFSNSFVTNYVIVVVLLMLDFWTVSSKQGLNREPPDGPSISMHSNIPTVGQCP